jgi:flavin-dependent dehydrogenase
MNQALPYDTAIAGGGLAGLAAAILYAGAGYRTVLVEKEQYPFHKVCGEFISAESRPFLEKLGVPMQALPFIRRLCISDVKGRSYFFRLPAGGYGISRYALDEQLYRIALQKGVVVHTGERVQQVDFNQDRFLLHTSRRQVEASIAIGSFGKRSNLDVKWHRTFARHKPDKLNHYIAVKYHVRYPQEADLVSLHNFPGGYCGISRIEDDRCCLCYLTTAHNLAAAGHSVTALEQTILSQNPHLKHLFQNAHFLYAQPLVISQISFHAKEQVWNHVLLAGDAAGLITPLCGNGMSMALHAGKLAFEAGTRFLEGSISRGQMEQLYIQQWQQRFSKRLRTGRMVQKLFGGQHSTGLFLSCMNVLPSVANYLIRSTQGSTF